LVERGFHVYAINPKQLDRFRDRYGVSGAKDDRRDAFVLADSLRTDQPCFRRVRLEDPPVIQLRELSRIDEELQREGNQLANRLREQLHRLSGYEATAFSWSNHFTVPIDMFGSPITGSPVDSLTGLSLAADS
jgi:transposase